MRKRLMASTAAIIIVGFLVAFCFGIQIGSGSISIGIYAETGFHIGDDGISGR